MSGMGGSADCDPIASGAEFATWPKHLGIETLQPKKAFEPTKSLRFEPAQRRHCAQEAGTGGASGRWNVKNCNREPFEE